MKNMIVWKADKVEWATFPIQNNIASFDKENEVFISLTNRSYMDGKYLYYLCSVDHRTNDLSYLTNWHKKLKIHTTEEDKEHYINVRGRRIYISGLLENL